AGHQYFSNPYVGLAAGEGLLVIPTSTTLVAYSIFGPPAPTGVVATGKAGAVDLSWTAAAGATSYNVYMGTAAGTESYLPIKTDVTGTTTLVPNLADDGTRYYFTVKAVGPAGISAPSSEVSAVPH